ncbi:MAG TPA: tetratricopeptide repeat protein [Opitutaceae bacterium]|nr:tetratricopeptide repeat protein [Opitutaceae bacterium]
MTNNPRAESERTPKEKAFLALRIAAIVLATAWIYAPAIPGRWIWDDSEEVAANPALRDPAGLSGIWLAPSGPDYFPLKTTVQWVEWHLWGDRAAGYHLASVALHVLSALLLWRVLWKLGARPAWFGGLLFAVHPVAVESVAWISELKNTLSLPPLLLAMGAYADFDRDRRPRDLLLAGAWFAAAMLCKSSVAMFPLVLLLFAWWRRGRVGWRDLACTAPFFAVSLALGAVTLWFQEHRAIAGQDLGIGGFWTRCAAAGRALDFYLEKCILPVGLMPVYPRWNLAAPSPALFLPWIVLGALAAWMWRYRSGWGRHALFGAGFFALNLAPVLGFVPMAYLRISWVADHLAYIALAGAAGLAAAGLGLWLGRARHAAAVWSVAAAAAAALALASRNYAGVFRDDETFWTYAAARNPEAWIAQNNLGLALYGRDLVPEAVSHYREALRLKPDFDAAHVNLGNALARSGRSPEAAAEYNEAIRLRPDNTDARTDLGNLALAAGRYAEAADQYEAVLRIRPSDPLVLRSCAEAHYRSGSALGNAGRVREAASEYEEALRLWPAFAQARANLGLALATEGRAPEAIAELEQVLRQRPDYAEAHAYLGVALSGAGRLTEAIGQYEEALRINPGAADVHYNLAVALRAAGRLPEAEAHFEAAARLGAGR